MIYQVLDDDDHRLDAHLEIEGKDIVFHSRGGTKGKDAQNADYSTGLRLLLERIQDTKLGLVTVWVDSSVVQEMPLEERRILAHDEAGAEPQTLLSLLRMRMKDVGRKPGSKSTGGNTTKRLRIRLGTDLGQTQVGYLHVAPTVSPATGRLPAEVLEKVTAKHIWNAVQSLLTSNSQHPFGTSMDYDVLTDDGTRLPPKAVFGIAATEALGFQVVPAHFSGGLNTVCFRKIEQAGYEIVSKGDQSRAVTAPPSDEEQEWEEGAKKLVIHMKAERGKGLSAAKKAEFISVHGALFCERCKCDPVKEYGEYGEACIEVHHMAMLISEMKANHKTKLSDLACLCANCHRIVHRELRQRAMLDKI
jgi:5-methylcytosine-specific restriction protein A